MKRKEGAFVFAQAAIFVGVIALVALPALSVNQTQVSTSSAVAGSLAFTSGVSPQGLQLKVTLNSSSIQSHGAMSGRVEVLNTLDRNVSLSELVQNQNISEWGGDDYVCPSGPSTIVGFALFRGHFAARNISAAGQPLQLAPPEVIFCAASMQPVAVTFLPKGDQAVATDDLQKGSSPVTVSVNATTGDCGDNPELAGLCTGTGLSGYWNDSIPAPGALNFTSPAFVYFPPGEYTIEATDLWDQYVYATFVVQAPAASSTSTTAVDPTDGFPRNAAGGWALNYVGSDPNPIGCNYTLGSTLGEGYSLSAYSVYDAVKEGGLVCISAVLVNVSGTIVTWGNSSEVETGFNVTDSSGKLVFQDSCIPSDEPTIYSGASNARMVFECGDVWDTSVASLTGAVPAPGNYTITAFARYPGTSSEPPVVAVTSESADFTILTNPVG